MENKTIIVPKEQRARYSWQSTIRLMSIRFKAIKRDLKNRKINHELCQYFHALESE